MLSRLVSNSLRPHGLSPHQASSVYGILQARLLEWVALSSSRALPDSVIEPCGFYVFCTGRRVNARIYI